MKITIYDDLEHQKAQEYLNGYTDGITSMLNQLVKMHEEGGKSTKYIYKTIKHNAKEYNKLCVSRSQK